MYTNVQYVTKEEMMYRLIFRGIVTFLCCAAMLLFTLNCININMSQSPEDNKTSSGEKVAALNLGAGKLQLPVKKPDLIISGLQVVHEGSDSFVGITVQNIGTVNSTLCRVDLIIDGVNKGTIYVDKIQPDGFVDRRFPGKLISVPEPHTFQVTLDMDNTVAELDETNNSKSAKLNYILQTYTNQAIK